MHVANWSFSVEGPEDGVVNMARDVELLERAEKGDLGARVYSWSDIWVTLGRFQKPEETILPGFDRYIVRPTGGWAVLHGHDMTVGIAAPHTLREQGSGRSVREVYRSITAPLVEALQVCGLDCVLAESTPFVGTGKGFADCFASASSNDVVDRVTGHKVCGCALRVTHHAALLQASIPWRTPDVDPASIIRDGVSLQIHEWDHERLADALQDAMGSAF